ncbi:MAG: hypothetical protein M1312_01145 [Patescibacteria group bacterium]|nr:hypothetical protein [Patescibacteria group bacterium]
MSSNGEKEAEDVSKTLNISLPFGNMPLPMKIITLLTSAGGLSIVASMFADIVRPQDIHFHFYLLRVITGVLMLIVGYGIAKRKEWSLWLYGGVSVISLFINPILSIVPIGITIYLYVGRAYFTDGFSKKIGAKIPATYQ